jgi:uncharacterized membrane protein
MLSDNRVFLAVGAVLSVLGLLSFVAVVILKVATGHSLDVYYTARLGPVTYVAALAAFAVVVAAIVFTGALQFINWHRRRRNAASLNRDP